MRYSVETGSGFSLAEMKQRLALEKAQLASRVFSPNETTRDDSYLLPYLTEGGLFKRKTDYQTALAEFQKRLPRVRVLDLGCGAGFWLEKQARDPRLETFGVSARDYRRPEDRPPVIYAGHDDKEDGPIFKSDGGNSIYIGIELDRTATIDNDHYYIADAHEALAALPTDFFHLIVSYQACRYLFDPLRILKQTQRVLAPGGIAFLESFDPVIYDRSGDHRLDHPQIEALLKKSGCFLNYGQYHPTAQHISHGLAIKKSKTDRLRLPIRYRSVEPDPASKIERVTYQLV